MKKFLIGSGILLGGSLLILSVVPYFEGLQFTKFMLLPLAAVPVLFASLLAVAVGSVVLFMQVLIEKRRANSLLLIPVILGSAYLIYVLPFPSYVDGMHRTMANTVTRAELLEFAEEARPGLPRWLDREEHDAFIAMLSERHRKALYLSDIPPRIEANDKYVSVFYGSALVKHWGFIVATDDRFPLDRIPEGMHRKVFDNVWVYHDIW